MTILKLEFWITQSVELVPRTFIHSSSTVFVSIKSKSVTMLSLLLLWQNFVQAADQKRALGQSFTGNKKLRRPTDFEKKKAPVVSSPPAKTRSRETYCTQPGGKNFSTLFVSFSISNNETQLKFRNDNLQIAISFENNKNKTHSLKYLLPYSNFLWKTMCLIFVGLKDLWLVFLRVCA